MKNNKVKTFDAVAMKRDLQKKAEEKLSQFSIKEQIEFLHAKFGYAQEANEQQKVKEDFVHQ